MKKCPKCNKEFDDAMRFCQTDGTQLVDAAPVVDPYKTMVARPEDIAAAMPPAVSTPDPEPEPESEPEPEPEASQEEVLDIPAEDPKKTMYASEDEIRSAMAEVDKPIVDVPPVDEPEPAAPAFISPPADDPPAFSKTTPPIPSPFGSSDSPVSPPVEKAVPKFDAPEPEPPAFVQPDPPAPAFNPFEHSAPEPKAPIAQAEFTPPPAAQDESWQKEEMQNPQYQPGSNAPAAGGQNKTLPIISLVFGILSLCCYFAPLTGLIALITGFLGMKNANSDPANYGGKGLAIAGMIVGGLFALLGLAYYVFILFFGGMGMMMEMMNQGAR